MSTSNSEILFERAIPAIQLIILVFVYYYRTEVRSLHSLGKVELRQIIRGWFLSRTKLQIKVCKIKIIVLCSWKLEKITGGVLEAKKIQYEQVINTVVYPMPMVDMLLVIVIVPI